MPEKQTAIANPSALPTAEIQIFGETHTLRYGFRAYQELGLNPFDVDSIKEYQERKFTPRELARQIWAGLLHEYFGRRATRKGETAPTVDDVMDELDPLLYVELWVEVQIAMGVDRDGKSEAPPAEGEAPANPPAA